MSEQNKSGSKTVLYAVLVMLAFGLFFYFYPAEIFEAKITESNAAYALDISLRAFFNKAYLPEVVFQQGVESVNATWKGWLLLVICLVGIPIMIGYRLAHPKPAQNHVEKED